MFLPAPLLQHLLHPHITLDHEVLMPLDKRHGSAVGYTGGVLTHIHNDFVLLPQLHAGVPVVHPPQQQQYHPQHHQQQQQQPTHTLLHPSALPAPTVQVVEQHTYVHLPSQEEPLLTRTQAAMPRQITCPACFSQGPTHVTRQSGCCAYLVSK